MVLTPVNLKDVRKLSSKDLVEMFRKSNLEAAEIEADQTGRDIDNVYSALAIYLKNHPELGVKVTQSSGKLILMKWGGEIPQE